MLKKIFQNKLFILVFGVVVLALLVFVIIRSREAASRAKEEKEHIEALSFSQGEIDAVLRLYERMPKPLNSSLPPNARYFVEFFPATPTGGPQFVVTMSAKNLREFYDIKKEVRDFFLPFDADPCKLPLAKSMGWQVLDWSLIKPDPAVKDTSCS